MLEKDPLGLEYISIRFVHLIFPIVAAQHPVFPPVAPVDILLRQLAARQALFVSVAMVIRRRWLAMRLGSNAQLTLALTVLLFNVLCSK